jgi:hypothetical protein
MAAWRNHQRQREQGVVGPLPARRVRNRSTTRHPTHLSEFLYRIEIVCEPRICHVQFERIRVTNEGLAWSIALRLGGDTLEHQRVLCRFTFV